MKPKEYNRIVDNQQTLCKKHSADYLACSLASKLGISEKALSGVKPIHGLRHQPKGDTCGWYIWSGDYSEDVDFFEPLHTEHVLSDPILAAYLGLAPGWRFLIGENGYEDVWFDPSLLNVQDAIKREISN